MDYEKKLCYTKKEKYVGPFPLLKRYDYNAKPDKPGGLNQILVNNCPPMLFFSNIKIRLSISVR